MSIPNQEVFVISNNTKELLERRVESDYRVHFIHYLLFEKGIRDDINKANSSYTLRDTLPGDMLSYTLVPDSDMKTTITKNLNDIARLQANKQLSNLKQIWLFCFEEDKETMTPGITIYSNPDSQDINDYFKENKIMLATALALEYADQNGETQTVNWNILSPGDGSRIEEYDAYLKEREADRLSDMFFISFRNNPS